MKYAIAPVIKSTNSASTAPENQELSGPEIVFNPEDKKFGKFWKK
jgi:hypothetical protein